MSNTRLYAVKLKKGGTVLAEAVSREKAIEAALEEQVDSVTIPTALEARRMEQDGAKILLAEQPEEETKTEGGGEEKSK